MFIYQKSMTMLCSVYVLCNYWLQLWCSVQFESGFFVDILINGQFICILCSYSAAAIVIHDREKSEIPYLDKFVISSTCQVGGIFFLDHSPVFYVKNIEYYA